MSKKKAPKKGQKRATTVGSPGPDVASRPPAAAPPAEKASSGDVAPSERAKPPQPAERASSPLIVGIGSSAGGLSAVGELLHHVPTDTGMAFVVVQHLDPHHESAMAELLTRDTKLPVSELTDGTVPEPNHVYIIAPNRSLVFRGGRLQLEPRKAGPGYYMPIDRFFRSLAEGQQSRSIGVVLSGSGSDGVLGLQSIKAEGGITFAQDETAAHGSMPRSAVASGCIDFVLPPAKIAEELARVSRHEYLSDEREEPPPALLEPDGEFQNIIHYLQKTCGIEFQHYKRPTLRRRVERRMLLRQFGTLEDYLKLLREDRGEVDALCQDIFIHVTSFFRDAEALELLKTVAFPRIMNERPFDSPIRMWIPGCSTGEEVYSLAILMLEYLEEIGQRTPVKIFATDIVESAIVKARDGIYLESMVAEVSPDRLRKYFVKTDEGYQITKSVRDLCVFARHDVTKAPPFSQLDLISCRNVLIYLGPVLQQRVLVTFHYGLKAGGFLLLGRSESVGTFTDFFEPADKHHRLYSSKPGRNRARIDYSAGATSSSNGVGASAVQPFGRIDVQREADRLLLAKYAPPGVVVDENNHVVQFRGQTGRFLEPAPGSPTLDILKMAREGLLVDLRRALESAKETNSRVRREAIRVKSNDHLSLVNLEVVPLAAPSDGQRHFVVLFEEPLERPKSAGKPAVPERKPSPKKAGPKDSELARLQQELNGTKTYLQSIIEEYEANNEELKASNEEIVSSNEELRSTSEELETAKEELQATNEELSTINDELQSRVVLAGQLNDDLTNLIESVSIPIAILDRDLKLRRFTPAAQRLLNLIPSDLGRLITDLRPRIDIPDWEPLLHHVQETLAVEHREVRDDSGRWYEMTIRPYKTQENKISGTVVVLVDIDEIKRGELEVMAARDYADSIVETAPSPILVLDREFRVRTANRSFCHKYQIDPVEARKEHVFGLGGGGWNFPRLRELLTQVRDSRRGFDNVEVRLDLPGIGRRVVLLTGRAMGPSKNTEPEFILLAIDDITERRRGEAMQDIQHQSIRALAAAQSLTEATSKMLHIVVDALEFEFGHAWMIDEGEGVLRCSDYYTHGAIQTAEFDRYSQSKKLASGEDFPGLVWQKAAPVWIADESSEGFEQTGQQFAGLRLKSAAGFPIVRRGKVLGVIGLYSRSYREASEMTLREFSDLTTQIADYIERNDAKSAQLESESRLRAIFETASEGIITLDEQGAIESMNTAGEAMFGYSTAEAVGLHIGQLIPIPLGPDRSASGDGFTSRFKLVSRPNAEGLGQRKDRRTFPLLLALSELPGRRPHFALIIRDISVLKEAESRVVQHERLAVIGELSAGLAHESRNALQRSQSCLEMLMHEVREQPKAMDLIDRIQKAQDYLLQLYEGVRSYAAPIHLERARIDLADLAQHVWDDVEPTRERPGTRVVTHADARLVVRREGVDPLCYADSVRMGQVFRNLFENALAACGENCQVTVSFSEAELNGEPALAAVVEDNGPGIPADLQPKVFQPFFTTKSRGTGLGLAIVRRIVEAHAGTITLDPAPPSGTRFTITLPRMRPK